jgi:hypothetical protein
MNPTLTQPRTEPDTPDAAAPAQTSAGPWRQARVDIFEAALLLRCTGITSSRYPRLNRRPPAVPPDIFAEFSDAQAANRLAALLRAAGIPVGRDELIAGGQRQYQVHRVSVPDPCRAEARRMLDDAWQEGWDVMLDPTATGSSSPRRSHRTALSVAAWRAALLAAGRRYRSSSFGVRVSDRDTATLLLRGGRTLGLPAAMQARTGCWLITVPSGAPLELLLRATTLPSR